MLRHLTASGPPKFSLREFHLHQDVSAVTASLAILAATAAGLLVGRAILAMDQFIVVHVPVKNGVWHKLALMKSFSERSASDEAVLATRQRKQDLREIERDFHRGAAVSGAQQAASAAARYARIASDAEARYDSEARVERATPKHLRRPRAPRRPAFGEALD